MLAKYRGTDKWNSSMFEKKSDEVNVTVEYEDGSRGVRTLQTLDGKWRTDIWFVKFTVIAWQSLPEPYQPSSPKKTQERGQNDR